MSIEDAVLFTNHIHHGLHFAAQNGIRVGRIELCRVQSEIWNDACTVLLSQPTVPGPQKRMFCGIPVFLDSPTIGITYVPAE